MPTATVERDERSNWVDRMGALSLTDTSSDATVVSQASSNKSRDQRRRARLKTASPRSPYEMPDQGDPEVHTRVTGFVRPTIMGTMNCGLLDSGRTMRPFPCDVTVGKVSARSHAAFKDWDQDLDQIQRQPCHVLSDV